MSISSAYEVTEFEFESAPTVERIDFLAACAVRPSEHSTHAEVTVHLGSYQTSPLPSADPNTRNEIMGFGGHVRYLFHDHPGLVDVEYVNGDGVTRETFLDGESIARAHTPPARSTPARAADPRSGGRTTGRRPTPQEAP